MRKRDFADSGMALVLVLVILATLVLFGTVAMKNGADEMEITGRDSQNLQSMMAAESGILQAVQTLRGQRGYLGLVGDTLEVRALDEARSEEERYATWQAEILDLDGNGEGDLIRSVGVYNYSIRTLEVGILSLDPIRLRDRPEMK